SFALPTSSAVVSESWPRRWSASTRMSFAIAALSLLEDTLGPDQVQDAVGDVLRAAGEHLGVSGLLRFEQAPDGDPGIDLVGQGGRHLLDPAGLLRLADAGDRGVAGWLPGGLDADDRRDLDLQPGGLPAAELLAHLDRVVLALHADDNADVGPAEHGRHQRWELAVEVVDRLDAGQHQVDLLAAQPPRQHCRPGVAGDPPVAEPGEVHGAVGALG